MPLTNTGRNFIATAIMNSGPPTFFDNTNAKIGVGDSATAFAVSQTDLQAASNKLRRGMEATYPQIATNVLTMRAIFADVDANWVWNEWGIFNHATNGSGTMLSRKVENLGTKTSAAVWQLTTTITVNVGA